MILFVGLLAAWWVGNAVERPLTRMALEPPMRRLMVRVVRVVVLLFALVIALDKFGFQIAPLVAGIGVAGLGIGIALQGVLSNVIAGLTIIFTKPFRVGEHIEIVGMKGDVHTIELFSTTLVHPDQSRIIIPNRKIVGEILHNFGTMRQLHLSVAVAHGSDLGAVLALVREVVAANPRVLAQPAAAIGVAQIEPAGVRIGVNPWVKVPDVVVAEAEIYRTWSSGSAPPGSRARCPARSSARQFGAVRGDRRTRPRRAARPESLTARPAGAYALARREP